MGGWRFPGGPHRAYGPTCKVSADLVVQDVRKSTFQHFTADWNFNVVEMALKTLHFVQGLPRTPLLFFLRYLKIIFFQKQIYEIEKWGGVDNHQN